MKPKMNSSNISSGSALPSKQSVLEEQESRRKVGRMLANKLTLKGDERFSNQRIASIPNKISSVGLIDRQSRSNSGLMRPQIIVRNTKGFSGMKHSRSSSLRALVEYSNPAEPMALILKPTDQSNNSLSAIAKLADVAKPSNKPFYDISESKVSQKAQGLVKAYGANTHKGIVRSYNEDRLSIVTSFGPKRNCVFVAVFDGHGGSTCADYLKDNFHVHLSQHLNENSDVAEALRKSAYACESNVLRNFELRGDFSGSCALTALVEDAIIYVANVGDCRAIISENQGGKVVQLTTDHKPNYPTERDRIVKAGGTIYQKEPVAHSNTNPWRVLPGRLSVSRTIGDLEAKTEKYGGKRGVVVAEPELFTYKITQHTDFLLLASDGVYDRLSNAEIVAIAHRYAKAQGSVHETLGKCIQKLMTEVFDQQATDNVSVVMLAFNNFCEQRAAIDKPSQKSLLLQPKLSAEESTPAKASLSISRERSGSNLASYRKLQAVKEVLRRNQSSQK